MIEFSDQSSQDNWYLRLAIKVVVTYVILLIFCSYLATKI